MHSPVLARTSRCLRFRLSRRCSNAASGDRKKYPDHFGIVRDLQHTFSLFIDEKGKYDTARMETLLDCSETSNEVRILTLPHRFIFSRPETFDQVRQKLSGAHLVFNLDPSHCLQIDRKMYHLEQVAELRHQGALADDHDFCQDLQKMKASHLDEGFFRNIFSLNFAEESNFDLGLLKELVHKRLLEFQNPAEEDSKQQQRMLQIAQSVIWESFASQKDLCFVNPNVKMMFEYTLLQGVGHGSANRRQRGSGRNARIIIQSQIRRASHERVDSLGLPVDVPVDRGTELLSGEQGQSRLGRARLHQQ